MVQCVDNQILIYVSETPRENRRKRFVEYLILDQACQVVCQLGDKWIGRGDTAEVAHFNFATGGSG
jgi:pre-mRNA-processing factor 17